jgi:hypothetical protein
MHCFYCPYTLAMPHQLRDSDIRAIRQLATTAFVKDAASPYLKMVWMVWSTWMVGYAAIDRPNPEYSPLTSYICHPLAAIIAETSRGNVSPSEVYGSTIESRWRYSHMRGKGTSMESGRAPFHSPTPISYYPLPHRHFLAVSPFGRSMSPHETWVSPAFPQQSPGFHHRYKSSSRENSLIFRMVVTR